MLQSPVCFHADAAFFSSYAMCRFSYTIRIAFCILVVTIILSIIIYRPFCKYICPLGAFYSVFNKVSFFKYRVNKEKCVGCGKCAKVCRMQVDPVVNANSLECIRCGRCKQACPTGAISCGVSREKIIYKIRITLHLARRKKPCLFV